MKYIKFYLIAIIFASSFSCKDGSDYLDADTMTGLTLEDTFGSAINATKFLNNIYGNIVPVTIQGGNYGSRWPGQEVLLEVATDNAVCYQLNAMYHNMNAGFWDSYNPPAFSLSDWNTSWSAIRACNLFLEYIDNVPENEENGFNNSIREIRKGECMFLKAFFYSEIFKQFGGLPLLDKALKLSDRMDEPRESVDRTVEYIVNLCNAAAKLLPVKHPVYDYGRATQGAALALKARVLLYAASPLWNNPNKPEDSPFRGKYDLAKWRKAAEAAKDVIDLNEYSLHPDISDLFVTRVNPELIFVRMNRPGIYMTFLSIPLALSLPSRSEPTWGYNQVSYNLIKEYEVIKDGKAYVIDDKTPKDVYDPRNPFVNRDPRFYRDCMFNGYQYQQWEPAEFGVAEDGVSEPKHNPKHEGKFATYTYCIKFADLTIPLSGQGRNPDLADMVTHQNYPYLRYAELLLNYAEAMNEAFGPEVDGLGNGKTALWAVNEVRTRSQYPENKPEYLGYTGGMPPLPSGLSKADFRTKLQRERRIELAFEEHRFWDVRRWKLLDDPKNLEKMTKIEGQIPVWGPDGVKYEIQTIENRVFDTKKMYRMPIPQSQMNANKNFRQNPGWDSTEAPE